jgi:hypothetical protein
LSAIGTYIPEAPEPQGPAPQQATRYWLTFAISTTLVILLLAWFIYSPGQDHIGSIALNGDGNWYQNYEPGFELQDHEIFFDGFGHSIENAEQADIIFLGSSTVLFGIDWRTLEEFERKHHVRIFNMGFAGVNSGEFSLRLIQKWGLHPKLWIIDADMLEGKINNSFFYMSLPSGGNFRTGSPGTVVKTSRLHAFLTVAGRNIRWRLEMVPGLLKQISFRSAKTGNWYLDNWPLQTADNYPMIDRSNYSSCPENSEEAGLARRYFDAIGGAVILIQVPSVIACSPRIHHLASALDVASFTVTPEEFSTSDGGWHLDRKSSRLYTTRLLAWLEQLPQFHKLLTQAAQVTR